MIHEFTSFILDEEDEITDDKCIISINMNRIEAARPAHTREDYLTFVDLFSGRSLTIELPYSDFMDIWRACTEDIKI